MTPVLPVAPGAVVLRLATLGADLDRSLAALRADLGTDRCRVTASRRVVEAALTDGLDFPAVKSSTIRNLLMERVDPVLWTLSRDFVGDTAETASLLWPAPEASAAPPTVSRLRRRESASTTNVKHSGDDC